MILVHVPLSPLRVNVVQELRELEVVSGQRTRVFALAGRTLEGLLGLTCL